MKLFLTSLFLLLVFFGCACEHELSKPVSSPLKYHFGSSVYITNGFYKGCNGYVTGYKQYVDVNNYSVNASCPISVNVKMLNMNLEIPEGDLLEDDSH